MKIAIIITRVIIGLIFLFSSVVVLFNLVPQPEMQGPIKVFNDGMAASVYLMPLIKVIELLCAIAFLSGRFVPLASIVIFPISVNIVLFHGFLAPEGIIMGIVLLAGNIFLLYTNRKSYMPLLAVK